MAEIAADRPGFGAHRDRGQPHAGERPQVGDEHLVVGERAPPPDRVKRIGVLHQEFAAAHHAESRPHLVAELPLDVIEIERQRPVRRDVGAHDVRDHFFVGRAEQHVAFVPVGDAQHLLAVVVVPPALAPQIRRLDRRHQDLDGAGAVLLLAHDLGDPGEHALAKRQPRIDAGRLLPDHAGAQHQPMGDDLGFLRRLTQDRQEITGQAHRQSRSGSNLAGVAVNRHGHENTSPCRGDRAVADRRPAAPDHLPPNRRFVQKFWAGDAQNDDNGREFG